MRNSNYFSTPPVVLNLLIINFLFFLATDFLPDGISNTIIAKLALFYPASDYFMPHQYITYMFLHGGFSHIFFNMFALWMFGRVLEYDLGSRRFLIFYVVCGIGAALMQTGVNWIEISSLTGTAEASGAYDSLMRVQRMLNTPTVGASGAIFGILLGFGMMHPNSMIMLMLPPIPMKAKYFVILYGILELIFGIRGGDSIAHFAHVGGMIWGFLLLYYWRKKGNLYY